MAISIRTRFETLKRDAFTCHYCGRKSPHVVLEVDHIVPVCEGGSDDPINLLTACWECNRGKAGVPLPDVMTAEDPHDRAIALLERERQLREYNEVLAYIQHRIDGDLFSVQMYWEEGESPTGRLPAKLDGGEIKSLYNALATKPAEAIKYAMWLAIQADRIDNLAYVHACLRNWKEWVPLGENQSN